MSLLESTKGKTVFGATGNEETLFISPTAIKDLSPSDPLLQTEIFGPILPILKYSTPANAKSLLNTFSPTTLGLYVFSSSLEQAHDILTWVQAGSAAINDVMAQIAPTSLPFGGVGQSGFGAYRGKASIDTFSHRQSVVTVPAVPQFEAMLGWRYPMVEGMGTVEFVKKNLEVKL
jgi:acyl-CoA reductase-like NAD-dependent aldehyde dehydrogenase